MSNNKQFERFENKIWLSSPTMHGEEIKYVKEAYDTNWMSTVGQNISEVERLACEKTGCKYGVALSSGTAALHMAVKLADIKYGDKVFCSDMTFSATANPIVYEGGIPVFIDTEYDTWNMCPEALEEAFKIYPDVKTVVLAHLYGTPGKIDSIRSICEEHNAILIEDAAESLGATYKGVQTGAFGKASAISFNGNKIITGSSGGMLLTNNKALADKVSKWSAQSKEKALWYQHENIGYNYRMSNVIAGIVRGQFPHLEEHIRQKKEIYYRYKDGLKELPVKMNPFDEVNSNPNFWLSCMIIEQHAMCKQTIYEKDLAYISEEGKSCPTEILQILSQYNVEGRYIWKPMHLQPVFKNNEFITKTGKYKEQVNDIYDVGMDIFSRGLCLPSDNKMTVEEQEKIIEIIKSCFD